MHLPNFPLKRWDRQVILRITTVAGILMFMDNYIEEEIWDGYAKVCVHVNLSKLLRMGINIVAKGKKSWQQF